MRRFQERHILAATQGAGGEAAENKDQDIVCEDVYFISLVGGLLHLVGSVMQAATLLPELE
jgi:hypothetical protein